MKTRIKRTLCAVVVLSFVLMGSNCHGTVGVGYYGYPGAYYGPYGRTGGVYVGTSVPIW